MLLLSQNITRARQMCLLVVLTALLLACACAFVKPVKAADSAASLQAFPVDVSLDEDSLTLELKTPDQHWVVTLAQTSVLGNNADVQLALYDIPLFFSGHLRGDEASWARLTQNPATSLADPTVLDEPYLLSGHLMLNGQLHELQHRVDMGGYALAPMGPSQTLLPSDLTDLSSLSSRALSNETISSAKAIKIGIVIDSKFNEQNNSRGLARALSIINGVDGIYQAQLGLSLIVENFRVYDDPAQDPLRDFTGTVEQELTSYREIRLQDSELPASLALVHLFSGHSDPERVIGLGWIGTTCQNDGYDLSISTPFPLDMLLAAHEIAHNLGAVHDDDTQCVNDTSITGTEVMWSEISGTSRPTFSSCSLQQLRNALNKSCVADNIDVSINMNASVSADNSNHQIDISVFNSDSSRSANQVVSTTYFPPTVHLSNASTGCSINQSALTCQHGNLPASGSTTASVVARVSGDQSADISSELVLAQFADTHRLDNRASISIAPNTDEPSGAGTSSLPANDTPTTPIAPTPTPTPVEQGQDGTQASTQGGSAGAGSFEPFSAALLSLFALLQLALRRSKRGLVTTLN